MNSEAVTNQMLYELIKDFKLDFLSFKTDVNRRFDRVESLIKEERQERIKEDNRIEEKLDKIYECRDRVAVKFTRTWMFASFFMAILASVITLAFDKAF